MNLLSAYGVLAHGLIFGALASLLPLGILRARAALAATAVALLAGLAPILHGIFGPPSVTLLCLAIWQLAGRPPLLTPGCAIGLWLLALPALASALGLGTVDPHALGFHPELLIWALVPLGIVLVWQRQTGWLWILAIGLGAYASGAFPNLWGVLVDPLLLLLALTVIARAGLRRLIAARRR